MNSMLILFILELILN